MWRENGGISWGRWRVTNWGCGVSHRGWSARPGEAWGCSSSTGLLSCVRVSPVPPRFMTRLLRVGFWCCAASHCVLRFLVLDWNDVNGVLGRGCNGDSTRTLPCIGFPGLAGEQRGAGRWGMGEGSGQRKIPGSMFAVLCLILYSVLLGEFLSSESFNFSLAYNTVRTGVVPRFTVKFEVPEEEVPRPWSHGSPSVDSSYLWQFLLST